jgi:hypothetical protein
LATIISAAKDRYLIAAPEWGVIGDLLSAMRGTSELCIDIIRNSKKIEDAIDSIFPTWILAFRETYDVLLNADVGVCQWLKLWSNKPYVVYGCDFSSLIGVDHFKNHFLPDIARQAETLGRAIYHLDGPGAIRHLDTILEIPEIRAVQYSPPPPDFSARPWIDRYKRIQDSGRSVLIFCPPEEVLSLSEVLNPEGLGFVCRKARDPRDDDSSPNYSPLSPEVVEPVFESLCRKFA